MEVISAEAVPEVDNALIASTGRVIHRYTSAQRERENSDCERWFWNDREI
jgi:hypothetical protein